jgi:hypothetical protein
MTFVLDVVYDRRPENVERLVTAIRPFSPTLRGAPEGLPFVWDERTIRAGLNFRTAFDAASGAETRNGTAPL